MIRSMTLDTQRMMTQEAVAGTIQDSVPWASRDLTWERTRALRVIVGRLFSSLAMQNRQEYPARQTSAT